MGKCSFVFGMTMNENLAADWPEPAAKALKAITMSRQYRIET
jgi:hypothetical protein